MIVMKVVGETDKRLKDPFLIFFSLIFKTV